MLPQFRHVISKGILFAFLINTICPLPHAVASSLPQPGTMVPLSQPLHPPILKGIKVHTDNPFRFDFILDQGLGYDEESSNLREESTRLIKYFLASITTPEGDLWVNLSPYEKDRIVPTSFGQTEMGRDLLAQDYLLKQVTASLIYPEDELGKKFWKRVYEEAQAKYGTTNIPVNTFNKVWIVPDKAVVYENSAKNNAAIDGGGHTAYVVESRLKVMLEVDYLSLGKNTVGAGPRPARSLSPGAGLEPARTDVNHLGSQIVREIVIPALTREVNEGANFAQLRQVYNSLILATWYKKKIKDSILAQVYANKNKISGIGINDVGAGPRPASFASGASQSKAGLGPAPTVLDVESIYHQYLSAFKKGVYNYIKEEPDLTSGQAVPRKYFSGGMNISPDRAMIITDKLPFNQPLHLMEVSADFAMSSRKGRPADYAMTSGNHKTLLALASLIATSTGGFSEKAQSIPKWQQYLDPERSALELRFFHESNLEEALPEFCRANKVDFKMGKESMEKLLARFKKDNPGFQGVLQLGKRYDFTGVFWEARLIHILNHSELIATSSQDYNETKITTYFVNGKTEGYSPLNESIDLGNNEQVIILHIGVANFQVRNEQNGKDYQDPLTRNRFRSTIQSSLDHELGHAITNRGLSAGLYDFTLQSNPIVQPHLAPTNLRLYRVKQELAGMLAQLAKHENPKEFLNRLRDFSLMKDKRHAPAARIILELVFDHLKLNSLYGKYSSNPTEKEFQGLIRPLKDDAIRHAGKAAFESLFLPLPPNNLIPIPPEVFESHQKTFNQTKVDTQKDKAMIEEYEEMGDSSPLIADQAMKADDLPLRRTQGRWGAGGLWDEDLFQNKFEKIAIDPIGLLSFGANVSNPDVYKDILEQGIKPSSIHNRGGEGNFYPDRISLSLSRDDRLMTSNIEIPMWSPQWNKESIIFVIDINYIRAHAVDFLLAGRFFDDKKSMRKIYEQGVTLLGLSQQTVDGHEAYPDEVQTKSGLVLPPEAIAGVIIHPDMYEVVKEWNEKFGSPGMSIYVLHPNSEANELYRIRDSAQLPVDSAMANEKRRHHDLIEIVMDNLMHKYAQFMHVGRNLDIGFFREDPIFNQIVEVNHGFSLIEIEAPTKDHFEFMRASMDWILSAVEFISNLDQEVITDEPVEGLEELAHLPLHTRKKLAGEVQEVKRYLYEHYRTFNDISSSFEKHYHPAEGLLSQKKYQWTDGHGVLNKYSFALAAVASEEIPHKVMVMSDTLSAEVFSALQTNGYINTDGSLTDKFDPSIDYDRNNDWGLDEVAGKKLDTILGLDRKFSMMFGDILMILRQAYRELQDHQGDSDGSAVNVNSSIADQVFWVVNVKKASGEEQYIVRLNNRHNEVTVEQNQRTISYEIFATPMKQYPQTRNTKEDYKGSVILQFDDQGNLINDSLIIQIQEDRRKAEPWLFGFLKVRLRQHIRHAFNHNNTRLHTTLRAAEQASPYYADETDLDPQDLKREYRHQYTLRELQSFIQQSLMEHGYESATFSDQKDMLKEGANVVNVGVVGNLSEDELSLLQAASHFEGMNVFALTEEPVAINAERFIAIGEPIVMFKNGKPLLNRFPSSVPLHYVINHNRTHLREAAYRDKTGVPTPGAPFQRSYLDLKDITMMELEKRGVRVPAWRSFINSNKTEPISSYKRKHSSHVRMIDPKELAIVEQLKREIKEFLEQNHLLKAVAKPVSGGGGKGVIYFDQTNIDEKAQEMAEAVRKGENFIIQERIVPPRITIDGRAMDWNIRIFVSQDSSGRLAKVVRIDHEGKAINISQSAKPWLLEKIAKEIGLTEKQYRQMDEAIDAECRKAFAAINAAMDDDRTKDANINATDFMGVDIIIRQEGEEYVPYIIELNDFHSGAAWDLDQALKQASPDLLSPEEASRRIGEGNRDWLKTIYRRALEYKNRDRAQLTPRQMIEKMVDLNGMSLFELEESTGRIRRNPLAEPLQLTFNLLQARHGQTFANEQNRLQGQIDEPDFRLNPTGFQQAEDIATRLLEDDLIKEAIAKRLPIAVITSLLIRTVQTSEPFKKRFVEAQGVLDTAPVPDEIKAGANEMSNGSLEKMTDQEARDSSDEGRRFREGYKDLLDATVRAPGNGESYLDVIYRTYQWINNLNNLYAGKTVVAFGHGASGAAVSIVLGEEKFQGPDGWLNWNINRLGNGEYVKFLKNDQAMRSKGGIDFNPTQMKLETRNEGGAIKFHMDPAKFEELQNAPGFTPVIINIQPLDDLSRFLGIKDNAIKAKTTML